MPDRKMLVPDASHPISITKAGSKVIVEAGPLQVAETHNALALKEASYPVVNYIPREDADMSLLERSDHTTYCPYKGEANYYNIPALGEAGSNAVWTYETPYEAVADIADHLAFYPDKVSINLQA